MQLTTSRWVLSALSIIERLHWIDGKALQVRSQIQRSHKSTLHENYQFFGDRLASDMLTVQDFILAAQDVEKGGIADRPDDMVDVFHTFFGIAGR